MIILQPNSVFSMLSFHLLRFEISRGLGQILELVSNVKEPSFAFRHYLQRGHARMEVFPHGECARC